MPSLALGRPDTVGWAVLRCTPGKQGLMEQSEVKGQKSVALSHASEVHNHSLPTGAADR